jgi:hypothetical protein
MQVVAVRDGSESREPTPPRYAERSGGSEKG